MNKKRDIIITYGDKQSTIPNSWERLLPEQFINLHARLRQYHTGELSPAMVKVMYICDVMGWDPKRINDQDALCNLAALADQITFIFNIVYPDDVASMLDAEELAEFTKLDPSRSTKPIGRVLANKEYRFTLDSCFCAQLVPTIELHGKKIHGYSINTSHGTLTTDLVAIQYLEARELISGEKHQLPLLASILYYQGSYDSIIAHRLASDFESLSDETLEAIAFNFISFNNFLFRNTEFSLLTEGRTEKDHAISIGATESLYNLTSDGYGDINTVKQINLIEYLQICRKKTIDAVRGLHDAKMKLSEIAEKTGLPFHIINDILL